MQALSRVLGGFLLPFVVVGTFYIFPLLKGWLLIFLGNIFIVTSALEYLSLFIVFLRLLVACGLGWAILAVASFATICCQQFFVLRGAIIILIISYIIINGGVLFFSWFTYTYFAQSLVLKTGLLVQLSIASFFATLSSLVGFLSIWCTVLAVFTLVMGYIFVTRAVSYPIIPGWLICYINWLRLIALGFVFFSLNLFDFASTLVLFCYGINELFFFLVFYSIHVLNCFLAPLLPPSLINR
jgi:hypothetical protein